MVVDARAVEVNCRVVAAEREARVGEIGGVIPSDGRAAPNQSAFVN
jgi:hypothetical protein